MAAAKIETLLKRAGGVVMFSKSYCPYCNQAKAILNAYPIVTKRIKVLELDQMGREGGIIQAELAKRMGVSRVTVPQVFFGNKLIGGCSDVEIAKGDGMLEDMVKELENTREHSVFRFTRGFSYSSDVHYESLRRIVPLHAAAGF